MSLESTQNRVLLTGATGFVGRFVLAELLRRRIPTSVIVRSRAHTSARDRIEEALAHFEQDQFLPRPRIIEGDLTRPSLGIAPMDLVHLQAQPVSVVHCAASIRFNAAGEEGEPYLSNVEGTRQLLSLCEQIPVESFHHVSTAYTQSRRQVYPRAWEVAVAEDAPAGNDYERSKILAEALVRKCTWISGQTFLRPSIVVGASRTGYTPAFHGFYSPLQIGQQIAQLLGCDPTAGPWFREQLGLVERDTKNIVPVDWVAAAIVHILLRPKLHGQAYHLTNPQPVSAVDIQRTIIDSLHERFAREPAAAVSATTGTRVNPAQFREQLSVYESYFGDDPVFDRTHADKALRSLPCPVVDYSMLLKLARFALQTNFGWPKRQPPANPLMGLLPELRSPPHNGQPASVEDECSLELTGPGASLPMCFQKVAGKWYLGSPREGSNPVGVRMLTSTNVLAGCLIGKLDPASCIQQGHWVIVGGDQKNWLATVRQLIQDVRLPASVE